MATSGQVHWHEGLFLQPHHLQLAQRVALDQHAALRRLLTPYPYGLVESRVSTDALENFLIRFDKLRVIMPSGVEVSFPENAELPPLDFKKVFEATTQPISIDLGVPVWYASRANTVEMSPDADARVKRLYRVSELTRSDENTGENPQTVLTRRINARLLLPDDDRTDLEVLPLLRVLHATGQDVGMPRIASAFVPPCMVLAGSPALRELARDLINQIEASRKELVIQISRGGFCVDTMRGIQFEQMLRLRSIASAANRLSALIAAPNITPFDLFVEFRGLLGELASLRPDRDQAETAPYDHNAPMVCFQEVSNKIRGLLKGTVAPNFLKADFAKTDNLLVAALTDEHFTRPNEYFLGVKTKEEARAVATLVENADEFKLMAKSMVQRNIFGVKLTEERHPPLELPSQAGLHYFRLGRAESQRMWDKIKEERELAIRWPGLDTSDFQCTLYMTVPSTS